MEQQQSATLHISVDCDCNANPAEPEMDDIGIFASLDPVAVDQACVDAVVNSSDKQKEWNLEMDILHQKQHLNQDLEAENMN